MIIFMGVAGAGKSVQGRMLADDFGLPWLSTGEFLRMLISGKKRHMMVAGKLLPDKEIIALIQKVLSIINTNEEFILDGFPRSTPQAEWLIGQVTHGQLTVNAVINLQASEAIVEKRLLTRGRPDDVPGTIKERFKEYKEITLPIIDYFKQANVPVYDIDGTQSIEEVHSKIKDLLKIHKKAY